MKENGRQNPTSRVTSIFKYGADVYNKKWLEVNNPVKQKLILLAEQNTNWGIIADHHYEASAGERLNVCSTVFELERKWVVNEGGLKEIEIREFFKVLESTWLRRPKKVG